MRYQQYDANFDSVTANEINISKVISFLKPSGSTRSVVDIVSAVSVDRFITLYKRKYLNNNSMDCQDAFGFPYDES